jgi:hypothetical protein
VGKSVLLELGELGHIDPVPFAERDDLMQVVVGRKAAENNDQFTHVAMVFSHERHPVEPIEKRSNPPGDNTLYRWRRFGWDRSSSFAVSEAAATQCPQCRRVRNGSFQKKAGG